MATTDPEPERPRGLRRKRMNPADEASLSLTRPIANWQAKFAWHCAMWGLMPLAGFPLGILSLLFGLWGWVRVRRRPDDLGLRHAIGSVVMGPIEIAVNVVGTLLILQGLRELT